MPSSAPSSRRVLLSSSPDANAGTTDFGRDDGYDGLGEYDPSEGLRPERETIVGNPQLRLKEKERSVTSILKELAAIQQQGPQKYCILGTRHCSYLHQQIIELLYVLHLASPVLAGREMVPFRIETRHAIICGNHARRHMFLSLLPIGSCACRCLVV